MADARAMGWFVETGVAFGGRMLHAVGRPDGQAAVCFPRKMRVPEGCVSQGVIAVKSKSA